ncbi:hypothetical protein OYC64_017751 [Pagothenia borchgrevinki]|uniref:HECT domain-containing protein n=1 Tax=Pagothenia borchgrevinki TaxID=8213 RepID=A0ABD2GLY0_PAGBO
MKEGLAVLGVLNTLQTEAGLLEQVFCGGAPTLSAATLLSIFTVDYSPRGSSRRALEEVAVGNWRDWLILVEDGDAVVQEEGGDSMQVSLEDVLIFASGASAIPAFGFEGTPTVTFLHDNLCGARRLFPEANTCAISIKLPLGHAFDEFCRYMTSGIIQSPTFGRI